jgi:hypothetical protein
MKNASTKTKQTWPWSATVETLLSERRKISVSPLRKQFASRYSRQNSQKSHALIYRFLPILFIKTTAKELGVCPILKFFTSFWPFLLFQPRRKFTFLLGWFDLPSNHAPHIFTSRRSGG